MIDDPISQASLSELRAALDDGLTSVELTESCLARIAALEPINAWIDLDSEAALEAASRADRVPVAERGALHGIPIGLKDIFCSRGQPVRCASRILDGFRAPYESGVTQRLLDAGAVLMGGQNMDEFAMGSTTESSAAGPVLNPWSSQHSAGGSSGGSAAATAASLCAASVGTDTGGSVRQPAAFCGVVGIKPTWGRVSRYGMIAFASSLDQAGTIGRSVYDAALLLEQIAGYDPRDATCADRPVDQFSAAATSASNNLGGIKLGVPAEYFEDGLAPDVQREVEAALNALSEAGAELVDISLPHTRHAVATYYLICTAEASSNLARFDGMRFGRRVSGSDLLDTYRKSRGSGFGTEVKRRIMLGTFVLSEGYRDQYYRRATRVRTLIREDFNAAFESVDAVVTPTVPRTAIGLGELVDDPLQMYLTDVCTTSANLAGLPAISVPCGMADNGLPVGLQIMAPTWQESTAISIAASWERLRGPFPLPRHGRPLASEGWRPRDVSVEESG